jgi:hypothetical protein
MKLILLTSLHEVLKDTRILRQYYEPTRGNPFSDEKSAHIIFTDLPNCDPADGTTLTPLEVVVTVGSGADQHYVVAK